MSSTNSALGFARLDADLAPTAITELVHAAAKDANWHPTTTRRKLVLFLEILAKDDPEITGRLEEFLDDAVSESWRARTARSG